MKNNNNEEIKNNNNKEIKKNNNNKEIIKQIKIKIIPITKHLTIKI